MLTELTEGFFTGEEGDSSMSTYSSSSLDEEEFSMMLPAKYSVGLEEGDSSKSTYSSSALAASDGAGLGRWFSVAVRMV